MTFIQLVNALARECSVAGEQIATTAGQTGENARLVSWVQQAYEDIQNNYFDWRFLKATGTMTTVPTNNTVVAPSDLNIWNVERIWDADGNQMEVIDYADYIPTPTSTGKPSLIIVRNDNNLQFEPTPDAAYTYTFDYYKVPHTLVNDGDEPLIPTQFQRVIVGRAMIYYGNYEAANEVKTQGAEVYQTVLRTLIAHQTSRNAQTYGRSDAIDIVIVPQ